MTDELRDLARAYRVFVSADELAKARYGEKSVQYRKMHKHFKQHAQEVLGDEFDAAKAAYAELREVQQ